jgi:hypothetical protein
VYCGQRDDSKQQNTILCIHQMSFHRSNEVLYTHNVLPLVELLADVLKCSVPDAL